MRALGRPPSRPAPWQDALRVARFARGRFAFRARPQDVFISSYPRSGTTWMQHIAYVLRSDGDVRFSHIAQVVPWFERSLALGQAQAHDFEALVDPRLFKSHLPRAFLPDGARYIYVQRDGRDVMASYYHFYCSHLGFDGDFDAFFERFMRGDLQYGSWFKHIAAWRRHAGDPRVLLVDYEDLLSDLERQLARIAQFLGLSLTPDRLRKLAELCDFSYMKRNEAKFDHALAEPQRRHIEGGRFIRRGTRGSYRELFSEEQLARFSARLARPPALAHVELRLDAFLH